MNKVNLDNISLTCYLNEATEISQKECHLGIISMNNKGEIRFEEDARKGSTHWERNPRLYEGKTINMTRRKDGSLRFQFKKVNTEAEDFKAEDYAFRVYTELTQALKNII
ncbi:MAG: hypothetical protein Q4B58_02760 [Bacteroidales bacterium]|nr:hypothetical protein [Bacteroidales bacterium]